MKAFCTGSQIYGLPREDSDLDLVVVVDPFDFSVLAEHAENGNAAVYGGAENGQLKFGKLNLICVSEAQAPAWKEATDLLRNSGIAKTRDEAITAIDDALEKHGQPRRTRAAA